MAIIQYDHLIIEWDDEKNEKNKRKHKLSFETAHLAFFDDNAISKFHKMVDGEERWKTLARLDGHFLVLFIGHLYEHDHGGQEYIRIITARRATFDEEQEYYRD